MKYKKHPCINPIQNPFKNAGTIYSTELEVTLSKKKLIS